VQKRGDITPQSTPQDDLVNQLRIHNRVAACLSAFKPSPFNATSGAGGGSGGAACLSAFKPSPLATGREWIKHASVIASDLSVTVN